MMHKYFAWLPAIFLLHISMMNQARADDAPNIVATHTAVFTAPAKNVPTQGMVDGPLLGNGDVGVVVVGPAEEQKFYIGKNDFWRRNDASVEAVGQVVLTIPALKGATFRREQDMALAEVRGAFTKDGTTVELRSWVDANENLLVTEITCKGEKGVEVTLKQVPQEKIETHDEGATSSYLTHADAKPGSREVAVVTRVIAEKGLTFTVEPGKSATVASVILSDLDAKETLAAAQKRAAALAPDDIKELSKHHQEWWAAFWAKSYIEIPDKVLEAHWYAAQYIMASCSREGKVAPGLWGNWITTNKPNWHGDFHMNYNFQAPFYPLYSSNHPEVTLPFYQAIIESVPEGQAMAKRHGWKGVAFPVGLGPWGLRSENPDNDWGQRSNAVFAAMNFIWQYQYTQDEEFLKKTAYPYLLQVADFWEDYLKFENGRYVIYEDAIHEGSGKDMNPLLSLGMVRTLFKNMIQMSKDLNVDEGRRAKWQDICDKISAFPTQERDGKTVFRYSEKGTAWWNDNTLGIHHIYPAGAIGLDSDAKTLEISRNMIDAMHRWSDGNGFASWYTACARVGYDPKMILTKMRGEVDKHSMPNLLLTYGGGGIENTAGFLAINEMLMQSHEGAIRFFPCWPKDQNASFGQLRAVGAFLVSAEFKDGKISGVKIYSEKGHDCTVVNPWPGREVNFISNNQPAQSFKGERFTFQTLSEQLIELQPAE